MSHLIYRSTKPSRPDYCALPSRSTCHTINDANGNHFKIDERTINDQYQLKDYQSRHIDDDDDDAAVFASWKQGTNSIQDLTHYYRELRALAVPRWQIHLQNPTGRGLVISCERLIYGRAGTLFMPNMGPNPGSRHWSFEVLPRLAIFTV